MTKNTRIKATIGGLIVFAALSIVYFNGVLTPTNDTAQMNAIQSNAGLATDTPATGPGLAQFRADCTLSNGTSYKGTVSLPALQSPQDLKAVELKTEAGDVVRFAQSDARCDYSPY